MSISDLLATGTDQDRPLPANVIEALDGAYGTDGLRAELDESTSRYSRTAVRLAGTVTDADGTAVGAFDRTITRDAAGATTARNTLLRVNPDKPAQGFARDFNGAVDAQSGVSQVTSSSSEPAGAFGQSRDGFDFAGENDAKAVAVRFRAALNAAKSVSAGVTPRPTDTGAFSMAVNMLADDPYAQQDLQELLDKMDLDHPPLFGDDDYPYPFEFSTIGWAPGATTWPGKLLMTGDESGFSGTKLL
jgi:hypothetical protein